MISSSTVVAQKTPPVEKLVDFARANYGTLILQKNGTIKNNLKLISGDNVREGRSTLKFIRKPKLSEDLVILELDLPDTKFTMGFDGEKTWALNNGEKTELTPELAAAFRSSYAHSYEALLRYKEDGSKIEYVDTKKIATLEIDIIDLTMADGTKTRYEVSRRSGRVLYLEYETKPATPDGKPIKYRLHYKDFKVVQNTNIIPYTTVVYENDVIVEERTVIEAAFGIQLEEKLFKPNAPAEQTEEKKEATPTKP
ncbi:MAG: hypothetical protein JST84_28390 [Acidobacteria bacterium]|nr:hypothetical protein [Acidobacteriota bacterium]